jgi:acyl transferase domain-containing protein
MEVKHALEGIAIVGMSGRMPGAVDLDAFWENLANGVESITSFSDQELLETLRRLSLDPGLLSLSNFVKTGYVLERVEWFDPSFFGLSAKEAELVDPQHRLFMECAWETLEQAGYAPNPWCPRVGVFAGSSLSQYLMANLYHHVDFSKSVQPLQTLIANDKDYLTTRTSYTLNLKGPSIAVQTACSTSLVAVCMACDSLRDYQCDLALAGGVTVMVPQKMGYIYEEGNVFSPDGHCRPFDARAAGTVFGSGVGVVALKRLEDAQADRDQILAVIRDSAVNNDGIVKVGYTAPSEAAQVEVIAMAQARAGISAETISYVEAHGTGTQLGDPIEIAALTKAFRRHTTKKGFCAVGSVKSNVGHLQAAAGIVSLIKTVLALQHKALPPSINFEKANPAINFESSPFYVNTKLAPWRVNGFPRRAAVSSFGMGGTNAHVILEEAPEVEYPAQEDVRRPCVLSLSAKSDKALLELATRYETYLDSSPQAHDRLEDVCFTANTGRAHFDHRLAVVGKERRELRDKLACFRDQKTTHGVLHGDRRSRVAFVFTGADYRPSMGQELYRTLPIFRSGVDECDRVLAHRLGGPVLSFSGNQDSRDPRRAGATTFVLEYGLALMWQSLGVMPGAVLGCGTGELSAACVAGVFSLEQALNLALDPAAADIAPPKFPNITFVSGRTGALAGDEIALADYWLSPDSATPKFKTGIRTLQGQGVETFLEIGAASLNGQAIGRPKPISLWIPGLVPSEPVLEQLLLTVSKLYIHGYDIEWPALDRDTPRRRLSLPTYPFERQRCWIEPAVRNVGAGVLEHGTLAQYQNQIPTGVAGKASGESSYSQRSAHDIAESTRFVAGGNLKPSPRICPERADPEPIAIIGLGCRFPGGVQSAADYWKLLCGGVDAIAEVPPYRWNIDDLYDPDPSVKNKIYSRSGGFLGPVDEFDAHFFGITPREARSLDPQQRLLLETSWEAIEYAQLSADHLFGSDTGVFLGISTLDNATNLKRFADPEGTDAYYGTGNSLSGAAGRLSYVYGLKGPCVAVETACSSSLVAVHLACQSLLAGECGIAMAAGVNLILAPDNNIVFCRARMLSPDGRCKTFSDTADGYGRSEGCGVIVLKRLSDAVANHDRVVAVIRGTAVNQDGPSGGLTVPNGPAQQAVIRQALKRGGVDPALVDYVEAHGTGTTLGDPIEVNALGAVFSKSRSHANPLIIGAVKSNIGHLEAAAGIAGLIKLALCLENRQIPASLHLNKPNHNIPWDQLPLRVATTLEPWPAKGKRRVGGVSAFGFAGTNAHAVLEESPQLEPEPPAPELSHRLLSISAKTEPALKQLASNYEHFLATCSEESFASVCAGANTGRTHFKHRMSVVASSPSQASRLLAGFRSGQKNSGISYGSVGPVPKIVFLFTGQGSQYPGMGRQLYETQPVFRTALQHCAEILRPFLDKPLLDVVYPSTEADGRLHETAYTQPALFALEYSLARLWESWGVRPAAVMGHSVGEYVAAWLAGVFSLEDGLKLIATRGRLMQALPANGEMVAVFAEEKRVQAALAAVSEHVAIAALNGPRHTVVSGQTEALASALAPLAAQGIKIQKLNVTRAFHSPLMDPILSDFRRIAEEVKYAPPRVEMLANVTGKTATAQVASADYWVNHLRQPVNFSAGLKSSYRNGHRIFLEIGPHPVLSAMCHEVLADDTCLSLASLRRGRTDSQQILEALGSLYSAGLVVDWESFERGKRRPQVVLPSYPFQRVRHWPYKSSVSVCESRAGHYPQATQVVDLLNQGDTDELVRLLQSSPRLHDVDRDTVNRVLQSLVEQHHEQLPEDRLTGLLYQLHWRVSHPAPLPPIQRRPGTWLIFADRSGVGASIAEKLREQGQPCQLAYRGDCALIKENDVRICTPTSPRDFEQLISLLSKLDAPLHEVLYLWELDSPSPANLTSEGLGELRNLGVTDLLHLAQSMAAVAHRSSVAGSNGSRIWVITRGAVSVDDSAGPPSVAQAPSWGLGRVLLLEHPYLLGGLVDLDPEPNADQIATLLAVIRANGRQGEQFAFRGSKCLVARLARKPPVSPSVKIQQDASYLIVGGLGGLGLRMAQWLIAQGAKHLALTGRSALSERNRVQVRELEAMGAKVLALEADVSSETDMAGVFSEVASSLLPLRGIVHAAGVLDDGVLLEQDRERFERVMAPKVKGAWILHQLSSDLKLDFFVLFSSISSLLGSPGQGNYASANAFLDALAYYRRARGQPGLSINWGPWAEFGMAAAMGESFRQRLEVHGFRLLQPADGLRTFGNLLGGAVAQVAVLPVDWSILKSQFPAGGEPSALADLLREEQAASAASDDHPRYLEELERAPVGERRAMLTTYLQQRVAEVIGMAPPQLPSLDQGFADMGLDSLMGLELKTRIEFDLRVSLSPTMVFNYPTIESLGGLLHNVLKLDMGTTSLPPDTQKPSDSKLDESDRTTLQEILQSSDEELAALIAHEYVANR